MLRGLCAVCCFGLVTAAVVRAQAVVVAGVADASTGAPIEGAQVRLPDVGRVARTNWIGEATIEHVPSGRQRIQVRKLGYAPSDIELNITADSVGPVFMLAPAPESMDTVFVSGAWHPARMSEYFAREKMGYGHFLSDSVLTREAHEDLAMLISMRFPGLRAVETGEGLRLVSTRPQTIARLASDPYCPVDIYLDGSYFGTDAIGIHPSDLAGVEYYTMGMAPVQYRRLSSSCGVLLLWSKW